ncbi:MAG: T9SS type A sorting domain-containing protein [Bacteroidia bacterium]|nr:T9SS type A sorting domain-containing protein [Bacteroidia bacterium]
MKKILLFSALVCSLNVFSQGYWNYQTKGVTDAYNQFQATASTSIIFDKGTNDVLSGANTIPFPFSFNGSSFTSYKACDNGYLTFDLTETTAKNIPASLPSATAPKNAIFALWCDMECIGNTQYTGERSQVFSYSYGSSPNRVHVVQWYGMAKKGVTPDGSNIIFMAIKLYEAGGFDIVYGGKAGSISGVAGYQNADGTIGSMIGGNTSFAYPIAATALTILANADMIVYKHIAGVQPNYDGALSKLTIPVYVGKGTDVNLKATLSNYGKNDLTSIKVHYSIDGAAKVSSTISTLTTANSGGSELITFPIPLDFATAGIKSIKAWIDNPNLRPDENNFNDTATVSTEVFNNVIPRKVLHEIFTSATCPPCVPGNTNLAAVVAPNTNKWNVIKYQTNFPGTGDPYYTSEVGTRFSYYAATFAPWLTVDGSYNQNSNSYTQAIFDSYAAKPSLIDITATQTVVGKTITVSGTITPVQAFSNTNLKLRIAVVERRTENNVKTNGETEFFNVMKKMLPTAAGTSVSFSAGTAVPYTQSFTFPGNYRLPTDGQTANIINLASENSVENLWNLSAVVFVEDDTKKEVWQSQSSAAVFPLDVKQVNSTPQFNIYPNPAQNNFSIEFKSNTEGTVRIFDISGKIVLNTTINSINQTIDCSNLNNGLYIVQIEANGTLTSQKLNISK